MLLGFYFLEGYMIRTLKPKHELNIIKLSGICSKLHNKNTHTGYKGIISQHFKDDIPESIIEYIYNSFSFKISKSKCKFSIMVCRGSVPEHIDEISKTCILIPIKIHKNNKFIEHNSVCLQVGLFYTFNDYNKHELVIPNSKSISYLIVIDFVK